MATGDKNSILARVFSVMPPWWQTGNAPVTTAILNGSATALATIYSLIQFVRLQTRIGTATNYFLDLIAYDYFGQGFQRRAGPEADANYRTRIKAEIFRPRVTRQALSNAVQQLTGQVPKIFEPWRPVDTGTLNSIAPPTLAYGGTALPMSGITADSNVVTADSNLYTTDTSGAPFAGVGAWGSYSYPDQLFISVSRPRGVGIPQDGGYNGASTGSILWTPSNLTGASLELWFDANSAASITLSGSNVTAWADLVHNVSMTPPGVSPVYATGLLNSLPGIVFSGSGLVNTSTSFGNFSNPVSLFAVMTLTSASHWMDILSAFNGAFGAPGMGFANSTDPSPLCIFREGTANNNSTTTLAINTPAIVEFVAPAVSGGVFGPVQPYVTGNTGGLISSLAVGYTQTGLYLGTDDSNAPLFCNFHEAVVLHTQASTTDRQLIEGYLAWRWGLQAGLPGGHPYKTAAPTIPGGVGGVALGAYGLPGGQATGIRYGNQQQAGGFISDAEIYAQISKTVAAGIIPWTRLT